mgnify:CR=1 FL=1
MNKAILQQQKIIPADYEELLFSDEGGAVVTFSGRVRKTSSSQIVSHIIYEVYNTMAQKELEKIVATVINDWSLLKCLIIHRIGSVLVGEIALYVAIVSKHRKESFKAIEYIVDEIKRSVPIWKKEIFANER